MNIKKTFLKLTKQTYPHGKEHLLFDKLPQNLEMDDFGNLFIQIGQSDCMFTSHLDTATSVDTPVNHVFDGNIIKTDGKSILGADDKAGVTIMLYMIKNSVPGLYYFFLGEEVGCVGSKKVAQSHTTQKLDYIKKVISFDRRGTTSIITYQASKRCCSNTFAKALADKLNSVETNFKYEPDPTGLYTDSAQFVNIYPECTNISVGYYSEHTFSERQDIDHLIKLAEAVVKIDWNSLPVERDPSKVEYDDYEYGWGGYSRYGYSSYDRPSAYKESDYYWDRSYKKPDPKSKETKIHFHDVKNNHVSSYTIDFDNDHYTAVEIHSQRLADETNAILDFLYHIEFEYKTAKWDGVTLVLNSENGSTMTASRKELSEYLPQLDLVKLVDTTPDRFSDLAKSYGYSRHEYYDNEYIGDW